MDIQWEGSQLVGTDASLDEWTNLQLLQAVESIAVDIRNCTLHLATPEQEHRNVQNHK